MFRFRNGLSLISNRLARRRQTECLAQKLAPLHMAELVQVLRTRELAGSTTTLRQLHKVSDLTQPEALRVVAALEKAGLVVVEHDLADAFESLVTLDPKARRRLEKASLVELD